MRALVSLVLGGFLLNLSANANQRISEEEEDNGTLTVLPEDPCFLEDSSIAPTSPS